MDEIFRVSNQNPLDLIVSAIIKAGVRADLIIGHLLCRIDL